MSDKLNKLTKKQLDTLNIIKKEAQEILMICKEAQEGSIKGEDFEKRINKAKTRGIPGFGPWSA